MGFSPNQIREMSLWDLAQTWAGFKRANGIVDKPKAPSEAEFDEAIARAFDG